MTFLETGTQRSATAASPMRQQGFDVTRVVLPQR